MGRSIGRLIARFAIPVIVVGIAFMGDAKVNAGPLKVEESHLGQVRLSVENLKIQWKPVSLADGAVQLFDPSISGFTTVGDPAGPRTPRAGGWLIVPPGTRPELYIIKENWGDAGLRPLMVQGVPVILPGDEPGFGTTSEIMVLPGQEVPEDAPVPTGIRTQLSRPNKARSGPALSLGEMTWWRGHRIVAVNLVPLRHDLRGTAQQVLSDGKWEVRFVPDPQASKNIPAGQRKKMSSRGDDHFGDIFLNKNVLSGLQTEAARSGLFPAVDSSTKLKSEKSGTLLGSMEGRLAVTRSAVLKVTYARLLQLGFIPDGTVNESEIRLYQRRYLGRLDDGSGDPPYVEIEVPIHMVGEGDAFNGDDYFLFYGQRLRDDVAFMADVGNGPEEIQGSGDNFEMNNEANFYWVAASTPDPGENWARMSTTVLPAAVGVPLTGYRRTEHHEEQLGFRELQPTTTTDRVYYNSANDTEVNVGFDRLWSPDPNGGDVEFEISLTGQNESSRPLEFHLVNAENQYTLLDNFSIATMNEVIRNSFAPAAAFVGASGKVVMSPEGNNSTDRVFSYLNWIKLSYDALYQAVEGQLDFHTGAVAGARPVEVSGFTTSSLGLIDLTDERNPVWVELNSANILADGENWKLSIQANNPTAEPGKYFVAEDFDSGSYPEFSYYKSTLAEDQINPTELSGSNPDLLVITHEEFQEALEPWLQHRRDRSGGTLNIHVVEVQDIYDWYSGGLKDPWAIKRLATHAITNWGTWSMVLVGDANENALELGVLSSARAWSKDWVPTHYHVQDTGQYSPELMAADKWYATMQSGQLYPVEDFPEYTYGPWEMYVGRLPCNSVSELNNMVDKIITVETLQPNQTWRSRGVFMADDAWSNGYGADAFTYFTYRSWEEDFARSERDSLVPTWSSGSPVTLTPVEEYLATYLDPFWEGHGLENRPSSLFKDYAETAANPPMMASLSAGALVAHYQGHGNPYVLSSEFWMEDRLGFYRKDVAALSNTDKPWVFFGMGCHISDWAQNPVYTPAYPREQSLSEKFMVRAGAGASATYGSSGYEYIDANRIFGEYIFRRWLRNPPAEMSIGDGSQHRSRWMLGELMWAAEADILAVLGANDNYREMIAQYTLLGDPLMMLDAGEPEVAAVLPGQGIIEGEVDLVANDSSNTRLIQISARDEAGIHRIEVMDNNGLDVTAQLVTEELPEGALDHQEVHYDLVIPIHPYDHQLTVKVFDTAGPLATDRHYELVLNLGQECEFVSNGQVHDSASFVFAPDEPVQFSATVTGSSWFSNEMIMELSSENLDLSDISFNLDKSTEMELEFTAEAPSGSSGDRSVVLTIDGYQTTYMLQEAGTQLPLSDITNVVNFPNPMVESTRFIFESGASSGDGMIRMYSTSGRHVAQIPFQFAGGGSGLISWDGRDNDGDELGNGTYLYRIEMDTPAGHIASEMQRLVVMR